MRTELVVPMIPLEVREGLVLPASHISVAFTRTKRDELDDEHGPKASGVEVRFDTRGLRDSNPGVARRMVAYHPLRADKRGTVRASCDEWPSRAQNLRGAQVRLIELVVEALDEAPAAAAPTPPPRRPTGLVKARDRTTRPRRRAPRPRRDTVEPTALAPTASGAAVAPVESGAITVPVLTGASAGSESAPVVQAPATTTPSSDESAPVVSQSPGSALPASTPAEGSGEATE